MSSILCALLKTIPWRDYVTFCCARVLHTAMAVSNPKLQVWSANGQLWHDGEAGYLTPIQFKFKPHTCVWLCMQIYVCASVFVCVSSLG